jgi:hypothetical protein
MRALIPALVLLAGVGLAVMLRATPPAATEQAAVATRLEAVLPILEDLGVERWFADPSCRALEHGAGEGFSDPPGKGCGPAQAFTAPAAADWERVAGVLGGAVPGGRVRQVSGPWLTQVRRLERARRGSASRSWSRRRCSSGSMHPSTPGRGSGTKTRSLKQPAPSPRTGHSTPTPATTGRPPRRLRRRSAARPPSRASPRAPPPGGPDRPSETRRRTRGSGPGAG